MKSIPLIESESQEHFAKFDFRTKKIHEYRINKNDIVKTIGPKKSFDPGEIFSFLEDVNKPDRTVDDQMLDCVWNERGKIELPITDELMAMFPRADRESIIPAVIGKKITWGEPIDRRDLDFIGLYYLEKERTEKEAKDDELSNENAKERKKYALPSGYSTHGGIGTKTKTAKVDKKEKPKLSIVPDKVDWPSRKKRHGKPARDVLKYFSQDATRLGWQPVVKAMYKNSKYLDIKVLAHYTGHYNRKGRFYLKGNEFLADSLGVSERTVNRALAWLKLNKVIFLRHRGYPGEGYSIWELPFNFKHVKAWKRKRPR